MRYERTHRWSCIALLLVVGGISVACSDAENGSEGEVALTPTGAPVSDWPLFRGDSAMTGVARTTLSAEPTLAWQFSAEGDFEATAAIADGVVFVGSLDGFFYAIDLETGELRWKLEVGEEIKGSASVHEGVVYFGDEMGFFHAVDAASGKEIWQYETLAGIISGANFDGDRLLFGSYDNSLYCLNRADGSLAWQVETEGYVHGTPAIVDGVTTVSGCDGYFWLINVEDGSVVTKIDLHGQAASSPAIVNGRAYVGTYENRVVALDLELQQPVWMYEHPKRKFPYYASAATDGEIVVIGGRDKIVHGIDPENGEPMWTYPAGARIDASAVIVEDRAFLATTRGEVLALDLATGEKSWSFETGSAFTASPSVASGRLVIPSLDGDVYCFQ